MAYWKNHKETKDRQRARKYKDAAESWLKNIQDEMVRLCNAYRTRNCKGWFGKVP